MTGDSRNSTLSPRECEVLRLVSQGLTNQAIAHRLGLSVKTVETYLHRAYAKLGVQNRAEAVVHFLEAEEDCNSLAPKSPFPF